MLKGIVISFALSLLWIVAQVVRFHVRRPRKIFGSILSFFAITIPVFPLVYALTPRNLFFLPEHCTGASAWLGLGSGILAHIFIFFAYVEFFYCIERAVTLRILVELLKRPASSLQDLQEEYSVEKMVAERVEAMSENGFMEERDGRYYLTRKGDLFAQVLILARRIFNLGPGQ